jgi:hypothetical protein
MINQGYRYQFSPRVDLQDAQDTLLLAVLAAEGIYGQARIRMDATFAVDESLRVIVVDASTDAGNDICGIFTSFLCREFGSDAFSVRPLAQEVRA